MDVDFEMFAATIEKKFQEISGLENYEGLNVIFVAHINWLATAKESSKLKMIRILYFVKQQSELKINVWRNT